MSPVNVLSVRRRQVILIYTCLVLCVGCTQKFIVRAEPTSDFPRPWSEFTQPSIKKSVRLKYKSELPSKKATQKRELQRVAVLELINRAPALVTVDEVKYLTNELRSVASYLPRDLYLVLTKESLEVLIDPKLNLEECVGSCEVKVGRLVGAKWIITGEVVRFGESLRVSLKLHQTETGQFLKGESIKGKTVEQLEEAIHYSALNLMKGVSKSWGQTLDEVAPGDLKKQLEHLKTQTP